MSNVEKKSNEPREFGVRIVCLKHFSLPDRALEERLAHGLPKFALDLVLIVARYVSCGPIVSKREPVVLCSFKLSRRHEEHQSCLVSVGLNRDNFTWWAADEGGIQVFDDNGHFIATVPGIDFPASTSGFAFHAESVVVGNLWRNAVDVYSGPVTQLKYVRTFRSSETAAFLSDVTVSASGAVYLIYNGRVQQWTIGGQLQYTWPQQISYALNLAVGSGDRVAVTDAGGNNILLHDARGQLMRQISLPFQTHRATKMSFDLEDNVLICDYDNGRVHVYAAGDGSHVTSFGAKGLHWAGAVHVGSDRRIYVTDCIQKQVFVFSF